MKNQIKKIQDFFKSKLLSQDFEIREIREHTMEIVIDFEYVFTIWLGNMNIPETRRIYENALSFMDIPLTNEESIRLNEILIPVVQKFRKESLLIQKKHELEQLQNEIDGMG